jgi:hypothetical protein
MNRKLNFRFLIFLLLLGSKAFPQVNDAGLWLSANVQKDFNPSWSLGFSEELRLMENISEAATIFSDLGLEYRFNKHLKASVHYRFLNDRRLDDSYESWQRLYMDVSYRQKFKPFVFSIRERLQSQFEKFASAEENSTQYYSRTRLNLKLDLNRKVSPYLGAELFHPFHDPASRFFDKARYSAGFEFSVTSRQMIDLNYMIQLHRHTAPANDYIIGLGYFLTL